MTNICFPKTNLVECTFSLRTSGSLATPGAHWDENDFHLEPKRLKKYTYRVPEYLQDKLKAGDVVVVHCQTGYQICHVVSINAMGSFDIKSYAPVVCKVDLSEFVAEIEKTKKLAAMKAAIDREKKRLESMVTYELIAEKSPEFKEMLEQFKSMGGEF